MTKTPGDIILLHFCTTNEDHMMYSSWDIRQHRVFCHSGPFFALWPTPKHSENQNFEKLKKPLGDITILHVFLKWQSYDVLFLRYGVRQTIFHFGPFIFGPFYPTKNLKNKIFSKTEKKKTRRCHHFRLVYHKWQSYDVWFLIYGAWHRVFCHGRLFFAFSPP